MSSVVAGELILVQAATMGVSFSTSTIGGAKTTTQITGGSIGEVLFTMGSNAAGGGAKTQYQKIFYKNTNSTLPLTSSVIYLKNSLDVVGSSGTVQVVSDAAGDSATYKITVIGLDGSSAPQSEDIVLNGTSAASGLLTFSKVHRCEYRNTSSGALTTATGNIQITRSSVIGFIPAGYYSATGEIDIGLVATLDDSGTTTDASVAPAGISFSRPRTVGTGLAVANAGSLTNGSGQGIWIKWVLAERAAPSTDIQTIICIDGLTS